MDRLLHLLAFIVPRQHINTPGLSALSQQSPRRRLAGLGPSATTAASLGNSHLKRPARLLLVRRVRWVQVSGITHCLEVAAPGSSLRYRDLRGQDFPEAQGDVRGLIPLRCYPHRRGGSDFTSIPAGPLRALRPAVAGCVSIGRFRWGHRRHYKERLHRHHREHYLGGDAMVHNAQHKALRGHGWWTSTSTICLAKRSSGRPLTWPPTLFAPRRRVEQPLFSSPLKPGYRLMRDQAVTWAHGFTRPHHLSVMQKTSRLGHDRTRESWFNFS